MKIFTTCSFFKVPNMKIINVQEYCDDDNKRRKDGRGDTKRNKFSYYFHTWSVEDENNPRYSSSALLAGCYLPSCKLTLYSTAVQSKHASLLTIIRQSIRFCLLPSLCTLATAYNNHNNKLRDPIINTQEYYIGHVLIAKPIKQRIIVVLSREVTMQKLAGWSRRVQDVAICLGLNKSCTNIDNEERYFIAKQHDEGIA